MSYPIKVPTYDVANWASKLPEPLVKPAAVAGSFIMDMLGADDPMSGAYPVVPLAGIVKPPLRAIKTVADTLKQRIQSFNTDDKELGELILDMYRGVDNYYRPQTGYRAMRSGIPEDEFKRMKTAREALIKNPRFDPLLREELEREAKHDAYATANNTTPSWLRVGQSVRVKEPPPPPTRNFKLIDGGNK